MIKCKIGWHKWSKWSEPRDEEHRRVGYVFRGVSFTSSEPIDFTVTVQGRTCERCGQIEEREVKRI